MIDVFGAVLSLIRADAAVLALVGASAAKVNSIAQAPPSVQLVDNVTTRRPFGPGSGRIGMQYAVLFARCYGEDTPAGAIAARQLAGAVSDALHNHRPVKVGTKYLAQIYASEIEGLDRDPQVHWPSYTVRLEVYAAAQAVA